MMDSGYEVILLRLVKNCGFAILIFTSLIIHQKDGGHYILWPAYCFCAWQYLDIFQSEYLFCFAEHSEILLSYFVLTCQYL